MPIYDSEMIEALKELLKIPSVTHTPEIHDALIYLVNHARYLGMKAGLYVDDRVAVIEIGEGDECVGVLVHVDVVSPGNLENWETPPFEPDIRDGKLYARGVQDDKGPLMASLYAMKEILDSKKPLFKRIQLIIGSQEETEWDDMEDYVSKYPLPDYGFTPDGTFPVCNVEKGCIEFFMEFPFNDSSMDLPCVTEITAGSAINTIPDKCEIVLSDGSKILATGKSVHSSKPEKGVNAIFEALEILEEKNIFENEAYIVLKMLKDKFGDIYGKNTDLYSESEYYNGEFIHRNVFSPCMIRTRENVMEVVINVRFTPRDKREDLEAYFDKLAKEFGGKVTKAAYLPPVYVSKEHPFVKKIVDVYKTKVGGEKEYDFGYAASYAKAMPNIVVFGPQFDYLPNNCHIDNENFSVKDLIKIKNIYKTLLEEVVQNKESFRFTR